MLEIPVHTPAQHQLYMKGLEQDGKRRAVDDDVAVQLEKLSHIEEAFRIFERNPNQVSTADLLRTMEKVLGG